MTLNELNAAYAERKNVQELQNQKPTDSDLKNQLEGINTKIDNFEKAEKVGKYLVTPQ